METSGIEGFKDLAVSFAMIESSLAKKTVKIKDIESNKITKYQDEINTYYGL